MLSLLIIVSSLLCELTHSLPEQGQWVATMDLDHPTVYFQKSMYKGSQIYVSLTCEREGESSTDFSLQYLVRRSPCAQEYLEMSEPMAHYYLRLPEEKPKEAPYTSTEYIKDNFSTSACHRKSQLDIPSTKLKPITIIYKTDHAGKGQTTSPSAAPVATTEKPPSSSPDKPVSTSKTTSPSAASVVSTEKPPSSFSDKKEEEEVEIKENITASPASELENTDTKSPAPHSARQKREAGNADDIKSTNTPTSASSAAPVDVAATKRTADENKGKTTHTPASSAAPVDIATTASRTADESKGKTIPTSAAPVATSSSRDKIDHPPMVEVWEDGFYVLVLDLQSTDRLPKDFKLKVTVRMMQDDSFIAAVDKPLFKFFGVMCLVYFGLAITWIILSAYNWRDLLRIQFWISGVILLGVLEYVVFFAAYESTNSTGRSDKEVFLLAAVVSCLKRSFFRMLLMTASLGYGIIKQPPGKTLLTILLIALIYLLFALIVGCMKISASDTVMAQTNFYIAVTLVLIEVTILWWIITSLRQTTRALREIGNMANLSLFKHFTYALVFAILACIGYMIWFLTQHRFNDCVTDLKNMWLDVAFWHLLFSIVLILIMILWRPNANHHGSYAFSPLLDADEDDKDDDDDHVLYKAHGVEKRAVHFEAKEK